MASKADILQALRNADAAGDTAAAIRLAQMYKAVPDVQEQPSYDPTEGMSGLDKFRAGMGKGMVDAYRGTKQLFNIGDQDQLLKDIEESRRLDKPLMGTASGTVGNIAGNIAATAPAMLIPGANTIVGGALIGAGQGSLTPTLSDSEALQNVAIGGAGGAGGVLAGRAIPATWNAFVSPFTERGREKIVGNVLRDAAGDNIDDLIAKLSQPKINVPGSIPTVAEVGMTPKLSTLEKAVFNRPEGKNIIKRHEIENNAARLQAIRGIAGDDVAMADAISARSAASNPLYEQAGKQSVFEDDVIKEILSRPSAKEAISRANKLAAERGEGPVFSPGQAPQPASILLDAKGNPLPGMTQAIPAEYSGKGLHYLKMGLDDMLDSPMQSGIGSHEAGAIARTKGELLSWLDNSIPEYGQARQAYQELSKPINQMEIGNALKNKLTPALTENGLPTRERAAQFAEAIRNQEALIQRETGLRGKTLADVMEPDQMEIINGVMDDLTRKANAMDLSAARGSDTGANLIADNMLKNLIGPIGIPDSWLSKAAGNAIFNALPRRAVDVVVPSVEHEVQGLLAEALINPKKAAGLLSKSSGVNDSRLYGILPGLGAYGLLGAN